MTDLSSSRGFRGDLDALEEAIGTTFGPTPPIKITQARIDDFGAATDDHQWIHVDPERAARGPFGVTIAHGYLTLSLIPSFLALLVEIEGVAMGVNYGLNRVRFPAPVPSGSSVSARVTPTAIERSSAGDRVALSVTVNADNVERPVCVAEVVVLYVR